MNRDIYVAGQAPDWSAKFQRFSPLVHSEPRPRPMAVRRTVTAQQVRRLRARWFGLGCIAALVPILVIDGLIRLVSP